jgi:uncharacterized repeat protein (TIGR01451 family)
MNTIHKNNRAFFLICISLLLVLGILSSVTMAAEDQIKVWSKAETKEKVKENGKDVEKKVPAVKALPGTIIYYTTEFKNISPKSVDGINIINPIPKLTSYVDKSAYGDNTDITFSTDGGKSWDTADKLKIKGKDGKMTAAKSTNYTHIRWKHKGPLASGKTGKALFQVKLLKP